VLSVHHWADKRRGLEEMRRVARGPVVLSTHDPQALISDTDSAEGMRRLRADLDSGEWERRWGELLELDALDLGYRVLVTRT
jgi:hypothetical protein